MEYFIYKSLSQKVLGMAFAVHRTLGPGLLESAYEGAFAVELAHSGVFFERQKVFPLVDRGEYVGAYIADLVVDNKIIIESRTQRSECGTSSSLYRSSTRSWKRSFFTPHSVR